MAPPGNNPQAPATIHDVAAAARVSPATVSRVLNGHTSVDPLLARRVRDAAANLGYRPNAVARSLRRRVAAVWALVISDIQNPFFTSLVRGVEDVANQAGCSVVLCNSDEDLAKERRYLEVAVAERMGGVILSPASSSQSDISLLERASIPAVVIDRRLERQRTDTVLVDNFAGAAMAVEELLAQGCRRIACVTGPARVSSAAERLVGYREALLAAGLEPQEDLERIADFKEAGGYRATLSLMASNDPPDGLFVANNLMTVAALRALADMGISVPGKVAVVGFDDLPWAGLACASLANIAQPTYDLGSTAATMLTERRRNPSCEPRTVVLQPRLERHGGSRQART